MHLFNDLTRRPVIRYGLPFLTVLLCTYLWTLGRSHYPVLWIIIGITFLLVLTDLMTDFRVLLVTVLITLISIYIFGLHIYPPDLQWVENASFPPYEILFDHYTETGPTQLREEFKLGELTDGIEDDLQKLIVLTDWVHGRWSHSGSNQPSKADPLTILQEAEEGASFRCVEYSIVLAGSAQALGMPARTLGLKTKRAASARSGAGHVVAEVWLEDFGKWAFADPQLGYIVTLDEVPLNAVEFQRAIANGTRGLTLGSAEGEVTGLSRIRYLLWISPYLYHFDFPLDQRMFVEGSKRQGGALMLAPYGAEELEVFQRHSPLRTYTHISSPQNFYRNPDNTSSSDCIK